MPLSFTSQSHGEIAFGFYNIETDGLLCDRLFFFSTDFCDGAVLLAGGEGPVQLPGHAFDDVGAVGDLHGAISGTRHTGYLGELYRRWPFPSDPAQFRQHGDGVGNRAVTEKVLAAHARPVSVSLGRDTERDLYLMGPYAFTPRWWGELLAYVIRGGYPTWDVPPAYVKKLQPLLNRL